MSERCLRCFRPLSFCLCKYIKEFYCGVKFLFLMHPKEAKKQRTGTGRLAKLALKESELIVGLDFSQNERVMEALHDNSYAPMLLYPGANAFNVKSREFHTLISGKKPLIIVIDGTWFCARKILERNKYLLDLPRLSFYGKYRSIFTIKREPKEDYISTIESCYYIIKELQAENLSPRDVPLECLMDVFREMIKVQLRAENERIEGLRPSAHSYDWKYTKKRDITL